MIRLYADECCNGLVIRALRHRGVDVLTVQEDGLEGHEDAIVLDRATELGRVLFSQDEDLLAESVRRQRSGERFDGVIYAHQELPLGACVEELELIAGVCEPAEYRSRVEFLPLKP